MYIYKSNHLTILCYTNFLILFLRSDFFVDYKYYNTNNIEKITQTIYINK